MKVQLLTLLLLATGLRLRGLFVDMRLHPDEAMFATFARAAALDGAWMLPGALDKPPLSIYAVALAMHPFVTEGGGLRHLDWRTGEVAARLPGFLASIVLVAVAYALASRLYRSRLAALFTALLVALSPFAVAFGATAFTDGLMLLFGTLALLAVAGGRWGRAGVWLALAFWSKQQAVFFLPLVVALGWVVDGLSIGRLARLSVPIAAGVALLLGWDAARAAPTGMWALAAANNDPGRLIRADEILPRLTAWLDYGGWLLGAPVLTAALAGVALLSVGWRVVREPRTRETLLDVLLLTYIAAYGWLHWLVAFNTYDRYLLPVLVPLALLTGNTLKNIIQRRRDTEAQRTFSFTSVSLFLCVSVLCLVPALRAGEGRGSVGGDRGEHDGIESLAAYLNGRALGAIIYDPWLGWELGYYLGEWTDKRRVYYPTPRLLAEDAARQPDPAPRYFVAPADEPVGVWLDALRGAGFTMAQDYVAAGFVAYELLPPST